MAITLVGQGYESTKEQHDYKIGTETTYGGWEMPMNISKAKDNYDKDKRPKCFNYNKYGHMAKECWKKKENDTRKCFKCGQVGHIAKNCKEKQLMKNRSIQEELDDENREKGFGEDLYN